jgi:hypothetical protein
MYRPPRRTKLEDFLEEYGVVEFDDRVSRTDIREESIKIERNDNQNLLDMMSNLLGVDRAIGDKSYRRDMARLNQEIFEGLAIGRLFNTSYTEEDERVFIISPIMADVTFQYVEQDHQLIERMGKVIEFSIKKIPIPMK